MATKIDGFEDAMKDILSDYAEGVSEAVESAIQKAGSRALSVVRERSPKRTGRYARGWRKQEQKRGVSGRKTAVTVYNATDGARVHLLEKGHQKAGGGRVEGIPHVAPAEEAAEAYLDAELPKAIGEVGK